MQEKRILFFIAWVFLFGNSQVFLHSHSVLMPFNTFKWIKHYASLWDGARDDCPNEKHVSWMDFQVNPQENLMQTNSLLPPQAGTSAIPHKLWALLPLPTCTGKEHFGWILFGSMISFAWICTAVQTKAESKPAKLTRDPWTCATSAVFQ